MISDFLISSAIGICIWMHILFIIGYIKKDNSIVDIGWGIGFIITAFICLFKSKNYTYHHILIVAMTLIWSLRISTHIFIRNFGKEEDARYKTWRNSWKNLFLLRSYLQIFMLQGIVLWIIALPIIIKLNQQNSFFTSYDYIGFLIWMTGLIFETIADFQLMIFLKKNSNQGKILTSGLWKYSRHPNYFGEALVWWGFGIMAMQNSPLALISPICITILLRFISGVPLAEDQMKHLHKFDEYSKQTNIFIPWFNKKNNF